MIEAAERLFAEKGLGGVSVKEIIRAAGAVIVTLGLGVAKISE